MNKTRAESLQTRECILDAGVKCFGQLGYDQTSITSIAQEAGVSRGAVYGHFADKEAIFRAVVDYNIEFAHFWRDMILPDDMHFADRLAEIYWHALENNPYVDFIFNIITYIETKPEFSDIKKDIERLKNDLWDYIDTEITRELRKRGRAYTNIEYMSSCLALVFEGIFLVRNMKSKIDLSKDAVRMYTNIICSAIMSETSPEWWKQVNPFSSLEVL